MPFGTATLDSPFAARRGRFAPTTPQGARQGSLSTGRLMDSFRTRGFEIEGEQNTRQGEALDYLTAANERASKPTFTQADEESMFGRGAEQAAEDSDVLAKNVRRSLGASGLSDGGFSAGLMTQTQLARFGQFNAGRRDARQFRAQMDAQDARERYQRDLGVAQFAAEGPSTYGSDVLQDLTSLQTTREGNEMALQAAKEQASAAKSAGRTSAFTSIASGLLAHL